VPAEWSGANAVGSAGVIPLDDEDAWRVFEDPHHHPYHTRNRTHATAAANQTFSSTNCVFCVDLTTQIVPPPTSCSTIALCESTCDAVAIACTVNAQCRLVLLQRPLSHQAWVR
jgi:hypothetical protein